MSRMLRTLFEATVVSVGVLFLGQYVYGTEATSHDHAMFFVLYYFIADLRRDVKGW